MKVRTFKKSQRLIHASHYKNVFNNVEYKCHGSFLLVLAKKNQLSHSRLGLAISKKHLKKAVDRNRVKRLIRTSFRENQILFENVDIVVLLRNSRCSEATNEQIFKELYYLWKELANKSGKSVLE